MADWTLILTTLGTASITGLFGYRVAQRNGDVALRGIEAENDRLREQHREDHLRNRQGTYHNLITADQNLQNALGHGSDNPTVALDQFRHLGNGAVLFGSDAVKDAVPALLAQYVLAVREAQELAGDKPPSPADIRTAFEEHRGGIHAASNAMIQAMREDVGPKDEAG